MPWFLSAMTAVLLGMSLAGSSSSGVRLPRSQSTAHALEGALAMDLGCPGGSYQVDSNPNGNAICDPEAERADGGSVVGLLPRTKGARCYDSTATVGDRVPSGATSDTRAVVNILGVSTVNSGGKSYSLYGYIYIDADGQRYFELSPSSGLRFRQALASSVPVLHALIRAWASGGPTAVIPFTEGQENALIREIHIANPLAKASIRPCFRNVPPVHV
jgi:hypothetical protein